MATNVLCAVDIECRCYLESSTRGYPSIVNYTLAGGLAMVPQMLFEFYRLVCDCFIHLVLGLQLIGTNRTICILVNASIPGPSDSASFFFISTVESVHTYIYIYATQTPSHNSSTLQSLPYLLANLAKWPCGRFLDNGL